MKSNIQLPALADDVSYSPVFFRLRTETEIDAFNQFLIKNTNIFVFDTIHSQLCELIKSLHPSRKLSKEELHKGVEKHLAGANIQHYGVWVFYPWSRRLVHLLDEKEFVEVRTNRNQYKITREERDLLATKKIGIVGLSVGQSIALTLAMERSFGELRLADFDELELSNLNRIRAPLHNMGLKKVVMAAREIAEIDPFLKLTLFDDGLTEENIDRFFTEGGKLDILVDECDSLDMKIIARYKARELGVPVVMDTSDRGLIDVERFDREPNRPLLHGLVGDINPKDIKGLTNEQKIPYILPMIGAEKISPRMKASMMEVEETINTWPQLATSVILGGAVGGDVCRRILLDQYHDSGRYYIDLDELVGDKEPIDKPVSLPEKPAALSSGDIKEALTQTASHVPTVTVGKNDLEEIITAACLAPSGGNVQPWKWAYKDGRAYLFHDEHYSFSLLDYNNLGSYVGLGAAIENFDLKAKSLGYTANVEYFPLGARNHLIAGIGLEKGNVQNDELSAYIATRLTNRNVGSYEPITEADKEIFNKEIAKISGAGISFITDREQISQLGSIVAKADKVRMMHAQGHYNTFFEEMRWSAEEAERTRDGIDIATVGATQSEAVGFTMAKDYRAIKLLSNWDKGAAFEKQTKKVTAVAAAMGLITMPGNIPNDYLLGGRAVQRAWLAATKLGYAFQPLSVPLFLFRRLTQGKGEGLTEHDMEKLSPLMKEYELILPGFVTGGHIFMFRLGRADEPKVKALRRNLSEVLFYI